MVTFQDAAKKGLTIGALSLVIEGMLHFKTIKHPLIHSVANLTGVTLADYVTKGDHMGGEFFKDWTPSTKQAATLALAFFISAGSLRLTNHFDRTISVWTNKSDALLYLMCYKAVVS